MTSNILILGAQAIIAGAPSIQLNADLKIAIRRLQDIESAARSLDALGVSSFDEALRTALDEASGAVSLRQEEIAGELSAAILQRFGRDSNLEAVDGVDAAGMLVAIMLEELDFTDDLFLMIDGVKTPCDWVDCSLDGETLEIVDQGGTKLAQLELSDIVAIALPRSNAETFKAELLLRDGRHFLIQPS